ncbi:MAG: hypothetical protein RIM72_11235 [Alphaproteobacteria bacterium]
MKSARFIFVISAVFAALLLSGCRKTPQDRKAEIVQQQQEIVGQLYIEKQRQAHEREVLHSRQQHEIYLNGILYQYELDVAKIEAESSERKLREIADQTRPVALHLISMVGICFAAYVIIYSLCQVFIAYSKERRKTAQVREIMRHLADHQNALTNSQREAFIKMLIVSNTRPRLPSPPQHG